MIPLIMHIATNESCPLPVDNFARLISDGTHLYGKHTAIIGAPAADRHCVTCHGHDGGQPSDGS